MINKKDDFIKLSDYKTMNAQFNPQNNMNTQFNYYNYLINITTFLEIV